jgi:hypothetical protein
MNNSENIKLIQKRRGRPKGNNNIMKHYKKSYKKNIEYSHKINFLCNDIIINFE